MIARSWRMRKIFETENVCNMPELAVINLVRSEDTGKIYVNRITHCGDPLDGEWTDIPLTQEAAEKILSICGAELKKAWEPRRHGGTVYEDRLREMLENL